MPSRLKKKVICFLVIRGFILFIRSAFVSYLFATAIRATAPSRGMDKEAPNSLTFIYRTKFANRKFLLLSFLLNSFILYGPR